MRRRKLLVALAGLTIVIATAAIVLWPAQDRITDDKLARLRNGMTRIEVESVIGAPGNYATGPLVFPGNAVFDLSNMRGDVADNRLGWITDTVVVEVQFDDQGRAKYIGSVPCRPSRSYFDDLLARAKRRWRRWFPM